ncbi:DUF927 domain-containing protein [Paenibacillus barengoltzii]|uniref:DUF927 domain-containing protein n=1 Tax=Paenibacillus barengoltzii TaxID=343517 RepID=UPI003F88B712
MPEIYRIHSCGWTRDNLFYPYTTQEGIIEVNAPKDSIMEGIEREIKLFPTGSIDKAKAVIHKQKDNPVFVLMLAGCLASPLVPLLKGMLNENIGIDLFGKTSAGKTSIQTIAMDLIYGLGDMLKTSWSKATPAGIWNTAKAINNLPFIMDDSHRMPEKLYGYPHDLINGKEGQKSTAAENGDWTGKDMNKDAYQGVLLFNGEISIHSVNPNDSAGLYGRVFMINEPPFPMNVGAVYVESLKDEAMSNRGHFACPWIEFIAKSDMEEMKNKIRELDSLFDRSGKDGLFGRLATKAQVLVLCVQMFNQLFQTDLNVDSMVELLTKSMEEQTDNVNVADRQMKIILDTVLEKSNGAQWTPKDCMFIDLNNPHNTFNLLNYSDMDICYKKDDYILIKNSALKELLAKGGYDKFDAVKKQLKSAGYLEDDKPKQLKYPQHEGQAKDDARMYGIKLLYEAFKHLLPQEEATTQG